MNRKNSYCKTYFFSKEKKQTSYGLIFDLDSDFVNEKCGFLTKNFEFGFLTKTFEFGFLTKTFKFGFLRKLLFFNQNFYS